MNILNPGQDFNELPESYVIFITRDDALGYGLPIYHIDRTIKEVRENFMDEAHIIYVNAKRQDDTELGRLDVYKRQGEDKYIFLSFVFIIGGDPMIRTYAIS